MIREFVQANAPDEPPPGCGPPLPICTFIRTVDYGGHTWCIWYCDGAEGVTLCP